MHKPANVLLGIIALALCCATFTQVALASTDQSASLQAASISVVETLQALITSLETQLASASPQSRSQTAASIAATTSLVTTSVTPIIIFNRPLSIGESGNDISALRQILESEGFYTYPQITSYFGPVTRVAARAFQKARNLDATGSGGPKTRAPLHSTI